LNSGDWVENMTALEYHNSSWSLFDYQKHQLVVDYDALISKISLNEALNYDVLIKEVINLN
jgi:hypothetical protein